MKLEAYAPRDGTWDKGRVDAPVDPSRCEAAVHVSGAGRGAYHQCSRGRFISRWCRQHYRMAVEQRLAPPDVKFIVTDGSGGIGTVSRLEVMNAYPELATILADPDFVALKWRTKKSYLSITL